MNHAVKLAAACGALLFAVAVAAEDAPVPRMFKGMQKGQWRAEITESSANKSGKPMPTMVICTDNLMQHQSAAPKGADSGCKRRLIKDTSSEAVMESVCPERTSTVTMKKENAKNVSVTMDSTSKRGPTHMKIHYAYLGACKPGQGTVSYDKDSEQCKKIRAAAAKAKNQEQAAKMMAMCPN